MLRDDRMGNWQVSSIVELLAVNSIPPVHVHFVLSHGPAPICKLGTKIFYQKNGYAYVR